MSNVVETVKQVVEPILEEHSFYLFDVEFVKENKSWYLRVYIDKKGGITIDDRVLVSDELSEKLDAMDPYPIRKPISLRFHHRVPNDHFEMMKSFNKLLANTSTFLYIKI